MKLLNDYRMKLVLIGFVAVILLCGGNANADFTWAQKTDMPTPRWSPTSAVVNGKIYVIGGGESEPSDKVLSTVEEYDPITDTWTTKADMPTARGWTSPSSAVVSGKIYVIGGWRGGQFLSTVEEYDPVADTWKRKIDMPTRRADIAACTVNGKIYAIGGYPPNAWVGLRTVEEYDPETDTWTRKADMPLGVAMLNACVVRGKIYAIGGRPDLKSRTYVQEYDPATDTWTRKADMPVGTSQMDSVVLGDKIVVIGGWLWSLNLPYKAVQIYDSEMDIWTQEADAPFLRAAFSAEVVNNTIYVIGGTDRPHPCPATSTVYELTVDFPPDPDLNADFKIDIEDLIILIEHWGQDEPSVDIAPPPSGDGIVDVQDLEVFMSYWGKELFDPRLVAHWKLDEIEGDIASDSANDNDGNVYGEPAWQPESGMVDGALELDGIDDYVSTPFVLNPADDKFSAFAWIKGGAPGQVVLSQAGGANWLCADTLEGNLITELKGTGRGSAALLSQTIITDGDWHRIGLVWDGSHRTLYVDDLAVAEDAQTNLEASENGLYIGAGTAMEPGSYWSGLIDDVRIYNRAVIP